MRGRPAGCRAAASRQLVGRDFARIRLLQRRSRRLVPLVGLALLGGALCVAALRNELIKVRYGLGDAMKRERSLREERRRFTARVQDLRDPARLRARAHELGLVKPERAVDLGKQAGLSVARRALAASERP